MKTNKKKTLFALSAICAVAACSAIVALNDSVSVKADENTPTATEFYMQEGAAVRTAENELGIRFTATITQDYWNALQEAYGSDATYSFYSKVTANGDAQTERYSVTPTFTSKNTFNYYSTIVYKTEELGDLVDEAADLAFTAKTYVEITKAGESTATTLEAYGETGARSMKAVANAEALDGNDDEELSKYFTVGNRSEEATGYALVSGATNVLSIPKKTYQEGDTETVYIGAQGYSATANAAGELVVAGLDMSELTNAEGEAYVGGDELYASVFDGAAVYSTKLVVADYALTNDTITYLKTLVDGDGNDMSDKYIVLAEDIDMSSDSGWVSTVDFSGTLNGFEHTIENLTVGTSASANTNSGLFASLTNATVKNIAFTNVTLKGNMSGTLAKELKENTNISNVFIQVVSASGNWVGGIADRRIYTEGTKSNIANVFVYMPTTISQYIGVGFGYVAQYETSLNDCYFVGGAGKIFAEKSETKDTMITGNSSSNISSTIDQFYAAMNEENSTVALTDFLKAKVNETWSVVSVSQANVGDLLTLEGNEIVVLTEDIDIGAYLTANVLTEWTSNVKFSGIFNGNGKKIENMSAYYGLFSSLDGATIKNVAIVGAKVTRTENAAAGTLAASSTGATVIENVFIETTLANSAWQGGIVDRINSGSITMTNAVVSVSVAGTGWLTRQGLFVGYANYGSTLTNCYFVSNDLDHYTQTNSSITQPTATNCAIYNADGDTKAEAVFLAAVSAEGSTVTLTEFVKSFCTAEYLN